MIVIDMLPVTNAALVYSNVPENDRPAFDAGRVYATGDEVIAASGETRAVYAQAKGLSLAATLTAGAPGRVNSPGHGQVAGKTVCLRVTAGGSLMGGLTVDSTYYIKSVSADYFTLSATVGGAEIAFTGASTGAITIIINDIGKNPASESTYWTVKGATNRMKAFDTKNYTKTEMPDLIEYHIRTGRICGGIYLGNVEANEVEVEVVDEFDGTVYLKTVTLLQSNSGSSFWNWYFKRIQRLSSMFLIDLPMYYNALIKVRIKRPGDTARVGVLKVGELFNFPYTKWGVTNTYKDFSTTTFDRDGVATTQELPWATNMSLDLSVDNDQMKNFWDTMMQFRGKQNVYIGIKEQAITAVCGRFTGLRTVIPHRVWSDVSAEFEGGV